MDERRATGTVIVVGAGVSGCACAATLAEAGHKVILINSAMDRVGLPAYGPDIVLAEGDWAGLEGLLAEVPAPVREVWLEAGMRLPGGEGLLNVDRRRVSVEMKRILEGLPELQFRQGLVVDVRVAPTEATFAEDAPEAAQALPASKASVGSGESPDRHTSPRRLVQVETVFGEVLTAEAIVVAVGLTLDGRIEVGEDVLPGGRFGEQASDGLYLALGALGAEFREVVLEQGARVLERDARTLIGDSAGPGARSHVEIRPMIAASEGPALYGWPEAYPPAPHLDPSLRAKAVIVSLGTRGADEGGNLSRESASPVLSSDGAATSEVYVAAGCPPLRPDQEPGVETSHVEPTIVVTRMPFTVIAKTVAGLARAGRLRPDLGGVPIWVTGRAGGASDYLGSLLSGCLTARDIAEWAAEQ
jgi:hypothetical protein